MLDVRRHSPRFDSIARCQSDGERFAWGWREASVDRCSFPPLPGSLLKSVASTCARVTAVRRAVAIVLSDRTRAVTSQIAGRLVNHALSRRRWLGSRLHPCTLDMNGGFDGSSQAS